MMLFDVRRYLNEQGVVRARYGNEWVLPCACDDAQSKDPHLWMNVEKGVGICYRCRARYDVADLIRLLEGGTYAEALAKIKDASTSSARLRNAVDRLTPQEDREPSALPSLDLPKEFIPLHGLPLPPYLEDRAVSKVQVRKHHIGVCWSGKYAKRVIVPVYSLDGRLVSFVARYMGDPGKGGRKVLYPKGSKISTVLFNHAGVLGKKTVVVTEGVFDALRVGARAVCLFGKHASQAQLRYLISLGQERTLVIMLDPDAEDDATDLAIELSGVCRRVKIARLPRGRKDPGECTRAELKRAVDRALLVSPRRSLAAVVSSL